MYEQEQNAIKTQQEIAKKDAELAAKLLEEEKIKIEREKEKKDWESTMNLIRSEAQSEALEELSMFKILLFFFPSLCPYQSKEKRRN